MESNLIPLDDFRLPGHPNARLKLNGSPLSIIDAGNFTEQSDSSNLTVTIGLATVLYNWCPDALAAFLDLDAWFSFTWNLSVQEGEPNETRWEIGRVGNQITFGTLKDQGEKWTLMLTYNVTMDGSDRGAWVPNSRESMQGDDDVTDPEEIDRLGKEWVREMVLKRRWETGKKIRHRFFIEYAPMDDVWGDGIPMNPHWLYRGLDLNECTNCRGSASSLQRCGRCGTATYCSSTCQRKDWAVHKDLCNMSMEDRGQALRITEKGGLIMWDVEKTMAEEGSEEESQNPNFAVPQLKHFDKSTA
ncbi:uncharacterized protein K460DRAFT_389711, partial [Cucurbitaria berberidis CBS 394.84]